MTNEEFQRVVLEELKGLKEDVGGLKEDVGGLKEGQKRLVNKVDGLEIKVNGLETKTENLELKVDRLDNGQQEIKKQLNAVVEQTADLTEFREKTNAKLDTIIDENEILQEVIGKHEVSIRYIRKKII